MATTNTNPTNPTNNQQVKKAWGYVRLSGRGRDGSIEDQKRRIREYNRNRDDLELATTLNEGKRTSGFDNNRDKYQLLKDKIRDESIDAVIVRDRARLSRDFDERLRLLLLFRDTGTELHVLEEGGKINLQDVQTAGFEGQHAMMDHIKKKIEINRSREAMKDRPDDAYHGGIPFGFTFDDDGRYLVPDPDEFDQALRAIELIESGESQRQTARETGINRSTIRSIMDRKEWYEAAEAGIPIGDDGPIEPVT